MAQHCWCQHICRHNDDQVWVLNELSTWVNFNLKFKELYIPPIISWSCIGHDNGLVQIGGTDYILMAEWRRDATPLLLHWNSISSALSHWYYSRMGVCEEVPTPVRLCRVGQYCIMCVSTFSLCFSWRPSCGLGDLQFGLGLLGLAVPVWLPFCVSSDWNV